MAVKLKQDGKWEFLYLKNVVVYYASVLDTKNKYESKEKEFSVLAFVSDEDRETLEDSVRINKQLFKVGKDKNKKRAIKYPEDKYPLVKGLNGIQLTLNEYSKQGKLNSLTVVDKEGQPQTELVGNGSLCNIKCFGYRNQDDLLVVSLTLVQVVDLVPYEGGSSSDYDEELGIKIPKQEPVKEKSPASEFDDDDIPGFDEDDNPFN